MQQEMFCEAFGRQLAEQGAQRAADHADRVCVTWTEEAAGWVQRVAGRGVPFICEEVRSEAERNGMPTPPDSRAWGAILIKAARDGVVRKTGIYRPGSNPISHYRPQAEWVKA
jgi:hypothetical protein